MTSSAKRRWFYLISLIITIPGLIFILLTPFTDCGLQFTIDYTGGTRWEIQFEDPSVTPDQVEAVFAAHGLEATAVTTGSGFIEIKTEQLNDLPTAPTPSASPAATRLPSASAVAECRRQCCREPECRASARPQRESERRAEREPERRAEREPERLRQRVTIRFGARVARGRRHRRRRRPATRPSRPRASSARSRPPSRRSSARSPNSAA